MKKSTIIFFIFYIFIYSLDLNAASYFADNEIEDDNFSLMREELINIIGVRGTCAILNTIKKTVNAIQDSLLSLTVCEHLIKQTDVGTTGYVINAAGSYGLGENIRFNPSSAANAITVNASDVLLDLKCFHITQVNNTANVDGIEVAANQVDVAIKNGSLQQFTGTGILVNQNCQRIMVDNVMTFSCNTRGIDFAGAAFPNQIINSKISNCRIFNCCTASPSDFALRMVQCDKVQVLNCLFNNNGIATRTLSVIRMQDCKNCDFENIKITNNTGTTLRGFDLLAPNTQSSFTHCVVRHNTNNGANTNTGFYIEGSGTNLNNNNFFTNCVVNKNFAGTTSTNVGYFLRTNSQSNLFTDCRANALTGGAVAGFRFDGGGNNFDNVFLKCIAKQNESIGTGNACYGFLSEGADTTLLEDCIASYNFTSVASVEVSGLAFTTAASNRWVIKRCSFIENDATTNTLSFGIRLLAPATIPNALFLSNISFANGSSTPALTINQLNGIAAGSASLVTAAAVTSITSPWTNLAIEQ